MSDERRWSPELGRYLTPEESERVRRVRAQAEAQRAAPESEPPERGDEPTGRHSILPDVAQLVATAVRRELRELEPPSRAEVRALVPLWKRVAPVVVVVSGLAGGVYGVVKTVLAAQDYMTQAVTLQVQPVRLEQAKQGAQVRRLDRKLDRILDALHVPDDPDAGAP